MDEQPGLSDQYRKASPWPLFIAFGFVLSEVGVAFDIVQVAVAGLLLFLGSAIGMAQEAGYVDDPWPVAIGLSVVLIVVGGSLDFLYGDSIAFRGLSIAIAGVLGLVAGIVGKVRQRQPI